MAEYHETCPVHVLHRQTDRQTAQMGAEKPKSIYKKRKSQIGGKVVQLWSDWVSGNEGREAIK